MRREIARNKTNLIKIHLISFLGYSICLSAEGALKVLDDL